MRFPEYFEQRERALLGARFGQIYAYQSAAPARGLTVNTLRCTAAEFLRKADFDIAPSPFCETAFLINDPAFKPGRHPYHHAGVYYSQEPSAAAPAALLGVRPGMRVLDMCAAPGGKSAQLAAALAGEGLLVANEYAAPRAEILRQNLERMGVTNAVVLNESTPRLAAALPAFFDRILVDAPCSGEGMFRKEAAALAQHSEALVQQCAALGRQILDDAAAMLAPGGVLVYSTCTFAPQEDEGQLAAFLARHPEFELCNLSALPFGSAGEANRTGDCPDAGDIATRCRRIWPKDGGEGHFMAKLQKRADAPPPAAEATAKPRKTKSGRQGTDKQAAALWQGFAGQYFPALAAAAPVAIKDLLLLPPKAALPQNTLHCLRSGVLAGSVQKNRFVPAHALFMAYGAQCQNQERLMLADPRTAAWLHGEEIAAQTANDGWCAVLVDGYPLGCGKVSGGKVKNHYPKALRNVGG